MNSKKSNEKIITILSEMEPIHDETDEEKAKRLEMGARAAENAEKEPPLAFARKAASILCIALWVLSVIALISGSADITVLLPAMLLGLGIVCGLNIPVFFQKGKIFDIVISIMATAICLIMAVGLFISR